MHRCLPNENGADEQLAFGGDPNLDAVLHGLACNGTTHVGAVIRAIEIGSRRDTLPEGINQRECVDASAENRMLRVNARIQDRHTDPLSLVLCCLPQHRNAEGSQSPGHAELLLERAEGRHRDVGGSNQLDTLIGKDGGDFGLCGQDGERLPLDLDGHHG